MTIINKESQKSRTILITGVAGFIGAHLAQSFLEDYIRVIGIDSLSDYYPVDIKLKRLESLNKYPSFVYYQTSISDSITLSRIFELYTPSLVIHLAAQAGVIAKDYLIPSYIESNIYGTEKVIQQCSLLGIPLIYASSSSVYGDCNNIPFIESEINLRPKSLYAATKLHNEQIASFYNKHLGLKAVGLRFFSIYGENMRPDMAISIFTSAIYNGKQITLYGDHNTARDFTYINDLVFIIKEIAQRIHAGDTLAPIYNIGSQAPVSIERVVHILQELLNRTCKISRMPLRYGESQITYSDSSLLYNHFGIRPTTTIEEGLKHYIDWYIEQN